MTPLIVEPEINVLIVHTVLNSFKLNYRSLYLKLYIRLVPLNIEYSAMSEGNTCVLLKKSE